MKLNNVPDWKDGIVMPVDMPLTEQEVLKLLETYIDTIHKKTRYNFTIENYEKRMKEIIKKAERALTLIETYRQAVTQVDDIDEAG